MLFRSVTNLILGLMDIGVLDPKDVARMCLAHMSEDDVSDMAQGNELLDEDEDEEDS